MKPAIVLAAVLLAGCGGTFEPLSEAGTDAAVDTSDVAVDVVPDVADGAPCPWAAGCCAAVGDTQCIGDAAFECELIDDGGVRGWIAFDAACD